MNFERMKNLYGNRWYSILPVKTGQFLEIHEKMGEGNNARIWKFKCLVIKIKKPNHPDGCFTVRGTVAGHVVEKIYPLSFNKFDKVLLLDEFKVRRARLYYIREKVGKGAKMKSIITAEKRDTNLLELARKFKTTEAPKKAEVKVEAKEDVTTTPEVTETPINEAQE